MLFDQKKFVDSIIAAASTELVSSDAHRYSYYFAEKEIREKFPPLFLPCVSWESEEEKTMVFDYMRQHGVQDQIERDFSPCRQVINDEVLYIPAYETWGAGEALLKLMTYRNSAKLVQASVQEHRNFVQQVAGNLLPEGTVNWIYKEPSECDRVIDRGYSFMTFPVVSRGASYFEYIFKLQYQQNRESSEREALNKTLKEVEKLTSLVTSTLSQLQSV